MRALVVLVALLASMTLTACGPSSTQFLGASQFPNGPTGCQARCAADGLEMSGFVYSGEFASSCVCRPRPSAPAAPPPAAAVADPSDPSDPATHAADLASRVRRRQMVESRGQ